MGDGGYGGGADHGAIVVETLGGGGGVKIYLGTGGGRFIHDIIRKKKSAWEGEWGVIG